MKKVDSCSSIGTHCCKKPFISKKRIPETSKKELIRLITNENYSLKDVNFCIIQASLQTKISYSTAKKLYNDLKELIRSK
jgi:hypothetical protein